MAFPMDFFSIREKTIVIFGVGQNAESFYNKYCDVFRIKYFTSNDATEKDLCGLNRIEPGQLHELDHIYIVVCAGEMGACAIESQLSLCFNFGEDYISSDLFDELYLGKRKLILVVGLCHQMVVAEGLRSLKRISDEYIILFYWHRQILNNTAMRQKVGRLSDYADYQILLKTGIDEKFDYLKVGPNIVNMPYYTMSAIYPQINWAINDQGKTYMENPLLKKKAKRPVSDIRAFAYMDRNVVGMLKKGLTIEQVIDEISNEDFYSDEDIDSLWNKMVHSNQSRENGTNLAVIDYMKQNYKNKKLFLDGIHYSNNFTWEIVRQIANIIVPGYVINDNEKIDLVDKLSKEDAVWLNETPVYPSVWKKLHLEWVDENTTYKMVTLNGVKELNFHDYMCQYVKYIFHALEIEKIWLA
jgi:hypothetical protein